MRKKFCLFCLLALILPLFTCFFYGCKKQADYLSYISELRYDVFLYSGDDEEIKVYCAEREVPYNADGIKGEMNGVIEIYAKFAKSYSAVSVQIEDGGGEMSYLTAKGSWYLSYSGTSFEADTLNLSFVLDGKQKDFELLSVLTDGVMTGSEAVNCVIEYAGSVFDALTDGDIFRGEIYVRLLYDEKCYYYVGVCSREGKINAYLVDGETGKVIAEHTG